MTERNLKQQLSYYTYADMENGADIEILFNNLRRNQVVACFKMK